MALGSSEVFGVVETTEGVGFAIRESDIVYPFLVTTKALQDAAEKNSTPADDLLQIWQDNYEKIIAIARRTFDLPHAVERYVIDSAELNAE